MADPRPPHSSPSSGAGNVAPLVTATVVLTSIVLAVILVVPLVTVAVGGTRFVDVLQLRYGSTSARVAAAEALRPFTLRKDPSITPMQAGSALNALQPAAEQPSTFAFRPVASRPVFPWRDEPLPPELLPWAHSTLYGGPNPMTVLAAVHARVSTEELMYLERMAHAHVWLDVDIVARASAVDIVGGHLVVPFPDSVTPFDFPITRYAAIRELAYASVSRAAYFLARNQRDSAETALRTVTSFGFALIDNGTVLLDQLIGAMLVGIGRDALVKLYATTGNPAARVLQAAVDSLAQVTPTPPWRAAETPPSEDSALMAGIRNEGLPRGARFEMLRSLALFPCTSVRGLVGGESREAAGTYAWAARHLARYPSEVAQIDLSRRALSRDIPEIRTRTFAEEIGVGAAALASAVFRNPRFASCTALIIGTRHPAGS